MTLLTEAELAERWKIHPTALRKWRAHREAKVRGKEWGPEFIRIGRAIRYRVSTIEQHEELHAA